MVHLPAARRFSVDEYHQMAAAGILTEDDPVELIEGAIVEMPPMGSRHAACVSRLDRLLNALVGDQAIVRAQLPVRIDAHSEPEPDLALAGARVDFYGSAHPLPGDVLLVIEVAESTVGYDRTMKAPLYARAGIAEYWLIDLHGERVDVHRDPAEGSYRTVRVFRRGERLTIEALPSVAIQVDAILGA
jgi:Uma2 family endonuclease